MSGMKIKLDKSLDFVRELLKGKSFTNWDNKNPDLIITESIPKDDMYFVVVWDRHDVKEIENLCKERYRYLRGLFLKEEIKKDPNPFINTLNDINHELNFIKELKISAQAIKSSQEFIEIGSLVKIGDKESKELENLFSRPRFTSLFIDKPTLQMMKRLSRILDEIQSSIGKLNNDYRGEIENIQKNRGFDKKGDEFDLSLIKNLFDHKDNKPVLIEPILLTGDTGVGKTLIAKWIHEQAGLKGSYQAVNSSGFSSQLLEIELFGYVKGAFTDAKTDKPGKALLALGGTLFLDEIGDMPLELQPRIMKFIEEKEFTPVGWSHIDPFYTPLLVVAATNKNLETEVKEGRFRKDLYARFRHRIHVPSIEDRMASLDSIVDFILQIGNKHIKYISKGAMEKLKSVKYDENWRGLERIVRGAAYKTREYGLDIILPEVIEDR